MDKLASWPSRICTRPPQCQEPSERCSEETEPRGYSDLRGLSRRRCLVPGAQKSHQPRGRFSGLDLIQDIPQKEQLFLASWISILSLKTSERACRKGSELRTPWQTQGGGSGGREGRGTCLLRLTSLPCLCLVSALPAGRAGGAEQHSHQAAGAAVDQHLPLCLPQHRGGQPDHRQPSSPGLPRVPRPPAMELSYRLHLMYFSGSFLSPSKASFLPVTGCSCSQRAPKDI